MGIFEATVLVSKADGMAPCLILKCGSDKSICRSTYLFNLPENFDRLSLDHNVRPKQELKAVFASEISQECLGGLGARLLNHNHLSGKMQMEFICPEGVHHLVQGMQVVARCLLSGKLLHRCVKSSGSAFCYADPFIQVAAVHKDPGRVSLPRWLKQVHTDRRTPKAGNENEGKSQCEVIDICSSSEDEGEGGNLKRPRDEPIEVVCIDLDDSEDDQNDEKDDLAAEMQTGRVKRIKTAAESSSDDTSQSSTGESSAMTSGSSENGQPDIVLKENAQSTGRNAQEDNDCVIDLISSSESDSRSESESGESTGESSSLDIGSVTNEQNEQSKGRETHNAHNQQQTDPVDPKNGINAQNDDQGDQIDVHTGHNVLTMDQGRKDNMDAMPSTSNRKLEHNRVIGIETTSVVITLTGSGGKDTGADVLNSANVCEEGKSTEHAGVINSKMEEADNSCLKIQSDLELGVTQKGTCETLETGSRVEPEASVLEEKKKDADERVDELRNVIDVTTSNQELLDVQKDRQKVEVAGGPSGKVGLSGGNDSMLHLLDKDTDAVCLRKRSRAMQELTAEGGGNLYGSERAMEQADETVVPVRHPLVDFRPTVPQTNVDACNNPEVIELLSDSDESSDGGDDGNWVQKREEKRRKDAAGGAIVPYNPNNANAVRRAVESPNVMHHHRHPAQFPPPPFAGFQQRPGFPPVHQYGPAIGHFGPQPLYNHQPPGQFQFFGHPGYAHPHQHLHPHSIPRSPVMPNHPPFVNAHFPPHPHFPPQPQFHVPPPPGPFMGPRPPPGPAMRFQGVTQYKTKPSKKQRKKLRALTRKAAAGAPSQGVPKLAPPPLPKTTTVAHDPNRGEGNKPWELCTNPDHHPEHVLAYIVNLCATNKLLVLLFLKHTEWQTHLEAHPVWKSALSEPDRISAVFHLCALDVVKNREYREWARNLPGKQVMVVGDHGSDKGLDIGLRHMLDRSVRLNIASPVLFPFPFSLRKQNEGDVEDARQDEELVWDAKVHPAWILSSVVQPDSWQDLAILPSTQKEVSSISDFQKLVVNGEGNAKLKKEVEVLKNLGLRNCPEFLDRYSAAICKGGALPDSQGLFEQACQITYCKSLMAEGIPKALLGILDGTIREPHLYFLGTGCSEPSCWRGGSAILLQIYENGPAMLIDAGEGAYGQIVRHFGELGAKRIVNSLECVWISHHHADHCLGLLAVLTNRSPARPPLLVIAPETVATYLQDCSLAVNFKAEIYDMQQLCGNARVALAQRKLGVLVWKSIPVEHSCEAYGLVLHHEAGWSIVYSGDTRPCPLLRYEGMNCTLLIHEATHAPAEQKDAESKLHSTWKEGLNEGLAMRAYRTILTHFSRRYPTLPTGLTAEELGRKACIAFDGMHVPFKMLPFLPKFNSAVQGAVEMIENDEGDV